MQYWLMNEYIGCGPAAVSMIFDSGIKRISNPHDFKDYCMGIEHNWSVSIEEITAEDFIFENFMMGLRTKKGLNREVYYSRFNQYPEEIIKNTINRSEKGTFIISESYLSLNEKSLLFLNSLLLQIYDEIKEIKIDYNINWP